MKSHLFRCHETHTVMLPYHDVGPVTAWCEMCAASVLFSPVERPPSTPEEREASMRETEALMSKRFAQFAATIEARQRTGKEVLIDPKPKDEAEDACNRRLIAAGFPKRHVAEIPGMDATGERAAAELADILTRGGCILWGDYGRGKTQIAVGAAMIRAKANLSTRYLCAPDLMRDLRDNMRANVPDAVFLRKYHECACLVIDDIHAALDDAPDAATWARGKIQAIVDIRYRDPALRTVLIANSANTQELNLRLGAHIISRIAEGGDVIRMNGKNYRK